MSRNITREELSAYFHLPIAQAAQNIGVCTTVLKKICRSYGILRWPQRKVSALQKRIVGYETELRYVENPERRKALETFIKETNDRLRTIMDGHMSAPGVVPKVKFNVSSSRKRSHDQMSTSTSAFSEEEVHESPRDLEGRTLDRGMDLLLNAISYVEQDSGESQTKKPRLAPTPQMPMHIFSGVPFPSSDKMYLDAAMLGLSLNPPSNFPSGRSSIPTNVRLPQFPLHVNPAAFMNTQRQPGFPGLGQMPFYGNW